VEHVCSDSNGDLAVGICLVGLAHSVGLYLNDARNDTGPRCAMVIISHPFPTVATRGRTLEESSLIVQLLTGAAVDLQSAELVHVEAIIPKVNERNKQREGLFFSDYLIKNGKRETRESCLVI
jgi:hypothetical protein